jgi:hypothetical protein
MSVRVLGLAGVLLSVVGCTGGAGAHSPVAATAQPQAAPAEATAVASVDVRSMSVQPASPPEPLPEGAGCHGHVWVVDTIHNAPGTAIAGSDLAFTGVIVEIGDAQWNTVDGAPPKDLVDVNPARNVLRLIRVKVATAVKGDITGEAIVAIEGGRIGCNSFSSDPGRLDLAPGQTFLWLTGGDAPRATLPGVPVVRAIWSVDSDGNVAAPMAGDGHLEVMSLEQAVRTTS